MTAQAQQAADKPVTDRIETRVEVNAPRSRVHAYAKLLEHELGELGFRQVFEGIEVEQGVAAIS
jgi:hypothetical protein